MQTTAPRPHHPDTPRAASEAAHRFMVETLTQLAALDVTDTTDVALTFNLVDLLLDVLDEPRSRWDDTLGALRQGPAGSRRQAAATLHRRLANLVARSSRAAASASWPWRPAQGLRPFNSPRTTP